MGRYYAMDRDKRWDRNEKAYRALVMGEGERAPSAIEAVKQSYAADTGDEFVKPTIIDNPGGDPEASGKIQSGDAVIFFNFRADRARQITRAFVSPDFDGFERPVWPHPLHFVTFDEYESGAAGDGRGVPADPGRDAAGEGRRRCRPAPVARRRDREVRPRDLLLERRPRGAVQGEDRALVPSPKVATYDLEPEMSAAGVADETIKGIEQGYPFVALNFANPDMVGHTGVLDAAITAVETVDTAIGRIVEAAEKAGAVVVVTADHGNAEEMIDEQGRPKTAHTTNQVPVIIVGAPEVHGLRAGGRLSDVAPTVLGPARAEVTAAGMTARSLIES